MARRGALARRLKRALGFIEGGGEYRGKIPGLASRLQRRLQCFGGASDAGRACRSGGPFDRMGKLAGLVPVSGERRRKLAQALRDRSGE